MVEVTVEIRVGAEAVHSASIWLDGHGSEPAPALRSIEMLAGMAGREIYDPDIARRIRLALEAGK